MKKFVILFLGILLVTGAYAQKGKHQNKPVRKRDAALFLNKTNNIMKETGKILKQNQVYTGGLVAAKDFQEKAIKEFKNNKYQACVNDSYTARRLAFRAYKANTDKLPPQGWTLNRVEQHLVTIQITPQKLDEILANTNKDKEQNIDVDDLDDVVVPDNNEDDDNSKGKTDGGDDNETDKGKK